MATKKTKETKERNPATKVLTISALPEDVQMWKHFAEKDSRPLSVWIRLNLRKVCDGLRVAETVNASEGMAHDEN